MTRAHVLRHARRTMVVVCWTALASLVALPMSAGGSSLRSSAPSKPLAGQFSSLPSSAPSPPSASGYFAPYPGGDITPLAESGNITAGSCTYRQAIDNPHISSTAPAAASVHGWWLKVSGTCPSKANVDTYLQGYWCDQFGCRWITVASGSADVYAGGGSGNRVTARRTCSATNKLVGWRGFVDVDLIGVSDPAGYTYSPPVNLYCTP
jgi:hypothetical protein